MRCYMKIGKNPVGVDATQTEYSLLSCTTRETIFGKRIKASLATILTFA